MSWRLLILSLLALLTADPAAGGPGDAPVLEMIGSTTIGLLGSALAGLALFFHARATAQADARLARVEAVLERLTTRSEELAARVAVLEAEQRRERR